MLNIIQKRKFYYTFSSILVLVSVLSLIAWGLQASIDFVGGSLLEIEFNGERPAIEQINESISGVEFDGEVRVQTTDEKGVIFRYKNTDEQKHQEVIATLQSSFASEIVEGQEEPVINKDLILENRFESVGPAIGQELQQKAVYAIIIVLVAIVFYIAWAFRKVSYPVASWKYGIIAIIALFHDIIITLGVFAFLGKFGAVEVGLSFIAALLTILGYSVNDTIVVFDRVRENLFKYKKESFEHVVNVSVNQTLRRSINTSITTLLVLLAIFLFGGETIKYFVLALIIGVLSGTYSSIFLASPILVTFEEMSKKLKRK